MTFDETGHKDHIATTKFSNSILHNSPVQFFSLYFSLPIMHSGNFVPKYSKQKINCDYSHLPNNRGGWNKHGGGAKAAKSINVEVGINVVGGIFWKN